MATVATAVIAAVLFTFGLHYDNQDKWNDRDIIAAFFAVIAFFLCPAIAVIMTKVLLPTGTSRDLGAVGMLSQTIPPA